MRAGGITYSASLEALLIGHEDWLHSVAWWAPRGSGDSAAPAAAGAVEAAAALPLREQLVLLSASQDRTMVLWRHDAGSGLWMNEVCVGDAAASCLGYYGGVFSPDGSCMLAHGFTGALHLWQRQAWSDSTAAANGHASSSTLPEAAAAPAPAAGAAALSGALWQPRHAAGGHYGAVVDLAWGADGRCVQSVSCDQTARLFTDMGGEWCELARTQVGVQRLL